MFPTIIINLFLFSYGLSVTKVGRHLFSVGHESECYLFNGNDRQLLPPNVSISISITSKKVRVSVVLPCFITFTPLSLQQSFSLSPCGRLRTLKCMLFFCWRTLDTWGGPFLVENIHTPLDFCCCPPGTFLITPAGLSTQHPCFPIYRAPWAPGDLLLGRG